jgi:hypothetical protein
LARVFAWRGAGVVHTIVFIDINEFSPVVVECEICLLVYLQCQAVGKWKYEKKATYIKAPPYFGAPKLARAMSNPPGYLVLASGGKVICKDEREIQLILGPGNDTRWK